MIKQLVSSTVMLPSIFEEQRGDERCPAGLMAGTDAGAVVSVEVLIKRNVIPPVRVALEIVVVAPDGTAPAARGIAQENVRQPPRQVRGDLAQIAPPPGTGRAFHLQVVPVIEMVLAKRANEEVVHRKPDRPAPVRVAAKEPVVRLGGQVLNRKVMAARVEDVRVLEVVT